MAMALTHRGAAVRMLWPSVFGGTKPIDIIIEIDEESDADI